MHTTTKRMNLSWWLIPMVAMASLPSSAAAEKLDERAFVNQLARGIAATDRVVACGLRTADWRNSVFQGYFAGARIAVMAEHPKASDNKINAKALQIFKSAKIQAAFQAEFSAPKQADCDKLNDSRDMQEMDAAAKIGLIFDVVNE